jgi:hypothetical protein
MTQNSAGGVYELDSNLIPLLDNLYFRAVASAPGYEDIYSDESGAFDFRTVLYTSEEYTTDTTLALSGGGDQLIQAKNCANLNLETPAQPPSSLDVVALQSPDCGHVILDVPSGTTLQAAGLVLSDNALAIDRAGNIVSQGAGNRPGTLRQLDASISAAAAPSNKPEFTGVMKISGNFTEYAGTLYIGIAGTNTAHGRQEYDQLQVTGEARLLGGSIGVAFLDPNNQRVYPGVK